MPLVLQQEVEEQQQTGLVEDKGYPDTLQEVEVRLLLQMEERGQVVL
jgi:hypothetical protein